MRDRRVLVEDVIRKMSRGGKPLKPGRLLNRISQKTGLSVIDVEACLATLAQEGLLEGVSRSGRPMKMVIWTGASLLESNALAQKIRDYFIDQGIVAPDNECLALAKAMDGLAGEDVDRLLNGLRAMQGESCDATFASARYLLGSAKALKGLSSANRLLDSLPVQDTGEMFVITAGPTDPQAVMLIENLRSFTAFADSCHTHTVLGVASYGYGLTMQNFAERLHAGKVTACPCRGERPDLKRLIQTKPVFLWGDLDQEGLRIYEDMRREIPGLLLSSAYSEMEKLAKNPSRCHPYHRLFEKEGQRPARGDTPEVTHLSNVSRDRAVDQEALGNDLNSIEFAKSYTCGILSSV